MQSRPLRVRMEAAERAGLEGSEREEMVKGTARKEEVEDGDGKDEEERFERDRVGKKDRREEDDDFMGEMEMEGF